VIAGRDEGRLSGLAEETGATPQLFDAADLAAVERCVNVGVERHGGVDGVANCVGSLLLKPAHLTSMDEWNAVIATNLTSTFATVRAAARAMLGHGGSIVLVSSAAARAGLANHEAIAAAKAGVTGLMLAAAASYASHGIRVNCVAPGLVRTPLTSRLTASTAALKASSAMHPLGRVGEPEDVASALAWLLDPAQSWVTGQILGVDGGLATVRTRISA
jgi:NAD(P)-dependent dehydrogenase (short-subunit alcohol dehydrogenase family)